MIVKTSPVLFLCFMHSLFAIWLALALDFALSTNFPNIRMLSHSLKFGFVLIVIIPI